MSMKLVLVTVEDGRYPSYKYGEASLHTMKFKSDQIDDLKIPEIFVKIRDRIINEVAQKMGYTPKDKKLFAAQMSLFRMDVIPLDSIQDI